MTSEEVGRVSREFLDLVMYSVYRAANEIMGEKTWDLVWRAGEILYEELERSLGLGIAEDPVEALSRIAEWFIAMGYVDEAGVRRVSEGEIEYVMGRPAIARGAEMLVREGMVPPHISTSVMFAALKKRGLRASIVGEPTFRPDGTVVERWRIGDREYVRP